MEIISKIKMCLPVSWVKVLKSAMFQCAVLRLKWTLVSHARWVRKHAEVVRQKRRITVLFEVWNASMWKNGSVYRLMQSMERFNPIIGVVPLQNDVSEQDKIIIAQQTESYFRNKGYNVVDSPSLDKAIERVKPDIVFVCQPYEFSMVRLLFKRMTDALYCYVPYGFRNTENPHGYNNLLQNKYWFNFVENAYIEQLAAKMMYNKGANTRNVGYPAFDDMLVCDNKMSVWNNKDDSQKRVIWAPHWSVNEDRAYGFVVSSFLSFADDMLELAEKYRDSLYFAFKPHPFLHAALCLHPDWGKERADAYYEKWANMPNAQVEQGDYAELFGQSDALIHDCGSFIVEYLMCDKPCLYLLREGGNAVKYNKVNQEALNCYYKGYKIEEVRQFIDYVLLGGNDSKKDIRQAFKRDYLISPNGKSAAQNIVDAILGEP